MQLKFSYFMRQQLPIMVLLSVIPGLGYVFLGWVAGVYWPAVVWYMLNLTFSGWGLAHYYQYDKQSMGQQDELHLRVEFKPANSGNLQFRQPDGIREIVPENGLMVFFPPDLEHGVSENLSQSSRLSLAINIGPAGDS